MNDTLKLASKGWVKIWGIDSKGNRQLLVDKKNAIQANSRNIVAKLLAGATIAAPDRISVYNSGVLVSHHTTFSKSSPTTDVVIFEARFDEASFAGSFDELRLVSIAYGQFSTLTGITGSKSNLVQLQVEWKITINAI